MQLILSGLEAYARRWLEPPLHAQARRGAFDGPDYSGGSMILSLLHAFCFRRSQPVTSNQNLITLKLILSPASPLLEDVTLVRQGKLNEGSFFGEMALLSTYGISRVRN